ncbi:hypothetical protein AAG906_028434 [Vitis piasezkii]
MDEAFIQLGVQRNLLDGHDKFREKKVVGIMTNIKATMEEFKAQMIWSNTSMLLVSLQVSRFQSPPCTYPKTQSHSGASDNVKLGKPRVTT